MKLRFFVNTFINFIGGNVSTNETEIKIKIENETIILKKNTSLEIENNIYVSANEIKTKLGFIYKFDDKLNALFFTK